MLEGKYFTTTITFDFRSCECVREKLILGEGEELWKGREICIVFALFTGCIWHKLGKIVEGSSTRWVLGFIGFFCWVLCAG